MKPAKTPPKHRSKTRPEFSKTEDKVHTYRSKSVKPFGSGEPDIIASFPRDKLFTSDSQLSSRHRHVKNDCQTDNVLNLLSKAEGDTEKVSLVEVASDDSLMKTTEDLFINSKKNERTSRENYLDHERNEKRKVGSHYITDCSPISYELNNTLSEDSIARKIREIHKDARKRGRIIRDSKARLLDLQKKQFFTDADIKEITERNELLLREMDRFDRLTRSIQSLVTGELSAHVVKTKESKFQPNDPLKYIPGNMYEPSMLYQMKMDCPPSLGRNRLDNSGMGVTERPLRSRSEIDLTRKLNESYDMQEKLVADNADLEVKRYILYKELMTKDMNLETCKTQINRLQGELKLMNNENALLHEKLNKNNPKGDASAMTKNLCLCQTDGSLNKPQQLFDPKAALELINKLESYKTSTNSLEKQLEELEFEVRHIKVEMSGTKGPGAGSPGAPGGAGGAGGAGPAGGAGAPGGAGGTGAPGGAGGPGRPGRNGGTGRNGGSGGPGSPGSYSAYGGAGGLAAIAPGSSACRSAGGQNICFKEPASGPNVPPGSRACGVCPPCPAPCNPDGPPTPAEREAAKLSIQLTKTDELYKMKVAECAMLRAELVKKKDENEKEACKHREVQNKLRELELKFEGLATHTNMMLGTKEQAYENEVSVRTLKGCYKQAREEIDELKTLTKEQNEQIQTYRVKYLQAQQTVEEQKRQMDMMDIDNNRISEQINMEIQKVKLKFQEKLQELAPLPDLLKGTQQKLKDAQQSQAIAEHNAEMLARELNIAREKIHALLHTAAQPPEIKALERGDDNKMLTILQQRVAQLTETNQTLKGDVERLKQNVIRMEEQCLAYDKRLHEKMHECAALGGDLDRQREEAARALQRANERTDTIKKCMQTTLAELEKQLAFSRSQVAAASKERDEMQARMQCQIKRLNDNFEQAQFRIMGLTNEVNSLRRTVSSSGEEGDIANLDCTCRTLFTD